MRYLVLNKATGVNITLAGTFPYIAVTKAEQKKELLGVEVFSVTVESKQKLSFEVGDSIVAFGRRYWVNSPKNITISDLGDKYVYDLQFEGVQYRFLNAILFDMGISQYATGTDVTYTANLLEVLRLIVTCANFNEGSEVFVLDEANVPVTKRMTFTFNDTNCLAALQTVCGKDYFNMLFKFEEQPGGTYKLRVGTTVGENKPYRFKVGQQGGAYDIKRSKDSNSSSTYTRLFAFGSSDNIATDYRGFSPKLRLPAALPEGFVMPTGLELVNDAGRNLNYIQLAGAAQHISYVKSYPDVKPQRTGKVTAIDGLSIYKFFDNAIDFNLNERKDNGETKYLLNGQSAKIHFNTGKLAGLEFEATFNNDEKSFVLVGYSDDKNQLFPDPKTTAFRVSVDDEYVILNINMPTSYIEAAERELLTEACKDLNSSLSPENKFTIRVRELYLKKFESPGVETNFFDVGDLVYVDNSLMSLDKPIQITSFTRNWLLPYNYTIEISDVITINYTIQMLGKIENLKNVVVTNKLDNPARTKRNWRESEELVSKINSVLTDMLLVGNAAGQYDFSGTFEFNVGGNPNKIQTTTGKLIHSFYTDNSQGGKWDIYASQNTMSVNTGKFIYFKCSKSSDDAVIVFSDTKIAVEEIPGFYHFPYCFLSSINTDTNTRGVTGLKGYTQIVGDAINTGHIRGNGVDIDLNAGTITGVIKMLSGLISNLIELTSNDVVTAGMQGDSSVNVVFWTGGTYQDALNGTADVILYKDKSGQLAGGDVKWDSAGNLILKYAFEATEGKIGNFTIFENAIINDSIEFSDTTVEELNSLINPPDETINRVASWKATGIHFATAYTQALTITKAGLIDIDVQADITGARDNETVHGVPLGLTGHTGDFNLDIWISDEYNSTVFSKKYICSDNGCVDATVTPILPAGTYIIHAMAENIKFEAVNVCIYGNYTNPNSGGISVIGYYDTIGLYRPSNNTKIGTDGFYSELDYLHYLYYKSNTGLKLKGARRFFNDSYRGYVYSDNVEPIISNINNYNSFILETYSNDSSQRTVHLPAPSELEKGTNNFWLRIVVGAGSGAIKLESRTGAQMYNEDGNTRNYVGMTNGDVIEFQAILYSEEMRYYITNYNGSDIH